MELVASTKLLGIYIRERLCHVFVEVVMRIYTKVIVPRHYNRTEHSTMRNWCKENFGVSNSKKDKDLGYQDPWYARSDWYLINRQYERASCFCFRNPAHATLFALRWS